MISINLLLQIRQQKYHFGLVGRTSYPSSGKSFFATDFVSKFQQQSSRLLQKKIAQTVSLMRQMKKVSTKMLIRKLKRRARTLTLPSPVFFMQIKLMMVERRAKATCPPILTNLINIRVLYLKKNCHLLFRNDIESSRTSVRHYNMAFLRY